MNRRRILLAYQTQNRTQRSSTTNAADMKIKNRMQPVHPGEILQDELEEIGLSSDTLAKELGVPVQLVTSILEGKQRVSADTAMRLARFFGTTPQMWLNLQQSWELRQVEMSSGSEIASRVTPRESLGRNV